MNRNRTIQLIGPGGAGKSTTGGALAARVGLPFIDLDVAFIERVGDISRYIDEYGYTAYARQNVELCLGYGRCGVTDTAVLALSSGFMTYPVGVHPEYKDLRSEINTSANTFVLLPSIDLEVCVAETVRRQLVRPFARSPQREEEVIRERYAIYMALRLPKIETMRSVEEVVADILIALG